MNHRDRAQQDRTRSALLVQRGVLTILVAGLVVALPYGPNRFALASVILIVQVAATVVVRRRDLRPIEEMGYYTVIEHCLLAAAGVLCPPAYVGANMMALASLGVNAPYLTRRWLRRVAPATVAAALLPAVVGDVSHAATTISIVGLLVVHMAFNRSGAVVVAKHAVARARWQAEHDALTGLPNRRVLVDRLDALDADSEAGLMMIDLDGFKEVNDTYGHEAGDELLEVVAGRLTTAVAEDVLVVRFGGDEFSVLVPGPSTATSDAAERIMEALTEPILVSGEHCAIGASVGMVHSSGAGVHELLHFSDIAMFSAKRAGGGTHWYPGDVDPGSIRQRGERPRSPA